MLENLKQWTFDRQTVLSLNRGQPGVYALFRPNLWVYVGQSEDIRERLLDHLNGDNPCITQNRPTKFVAEVIHSAAERDRREKELILRLQPVCNRRVG